jgi:regulation of enolase protein 1 (concanavalin A-like superfamily)
MLPWLVFDKNCTAHRVREDVVIVSAVDYGNICSHLNFKTIQANMNKSPQKMLPLTTFLFFLCLISNSAFATTNSWVYFDSPGHLSYRTWSNGNRIMDFSSSGYMGGGVAIPNVATVVTVNPSGGDDTTAIKNAISTAASQPLVNGFRGAVQLGSGTFHVSSQININASGVVVRGAGSTNGTTIVMTGSSAFKLFNLAGSGSPSQSGTVNMTDSYVASSATGFNVSSASGFSVGDSVIINRTVTTSWINFMGMEPGGSGGLDTNQTWIPAGTVITADRKISAISGNHITLDAPLADSFDTTYLGSPAGTISKYSWSGRLSQVGLEHLRIQAPATNAAYTAVYMDNMVDSWVRDITIQDGVNSFTVQTGVKRVTVDSVNITRTLVISSSAPPWDFSCNGAQILFNKCQSSGTGVWPFMTAGESTGPIALLNFFSTENGGISPHQRWSTALLSDNCSLPNAPSGTQGISYRNRANHGSGQGWTTGWSVAWNVVTPYFLVSAAPGTENWCIGGIGTKTSTSDPDGIYDQLGSIVTPNSLYLEQLKERLGGQAVENIGYTMFTISATPSSQSVTAGSPATFTVNVADPTLMSNVVALSASGLPAGATAQFSPASVQGKGSSTLTIDTSTSTPAGTYTLTITGTSASLQHTTTFSLTVNPAPDFSLSASPGSLTVVQGNNGTSTITETDLNGFNGSVTLSASGLPNGVTAVFSPNPTTSTSTLTLTASSTATTGTATVTITGTSGSLQHTTTVSLTVNASASLPAGWTGADIGAVGLAGSASYSSGTFTVSGSGSDIWNAGDQFNYAYQSVSGDTTIIARVVSENGTQSFAKAGVMIRESLATNSVEASVLLTPTNGVAMEIRPTTGAASINVTGWIAGVKPAQWLKLVRSGDTFTGYYSADGSSWTQIAATNVTMNSSATAGLAVTSHDNTSLNTATFDNVSIGSGSIDTAAVYELQNEASGLVLNNQGSLTNGSAITQWTSGSSVNLQWTFIPTSGGYYQINSVKSGLDAVVQSASTSQGAGIIQWSFGAAGNDQWLPQQNSDGSYTFFNLHSGLVLEDPASSTNKTTQMDQWGSNGGSNQKWQLIKQ